jgi:serine/threonine protein kinase/dipeptidyl aminopeptidase/acylaminoacyl peptidase
MRVQFTYRDRGTSSPLSRDPSDLHSWCVRAFIELIPARTTAGRQQAAGFGADSARHTGAARIIHPLAVIPGTRLGPYEVLAAIGAGGMGEVYRATDTTLGRQVAIKLLPDAFAADAERLARFEREAKTLAALNHPHIAAIYGFEKSGGAYALVMELVEGDDLSQRIARGAIPLDEALPIAKQIAEALEAAHELGIIHRDLKPANIKVRADGTVKVLDFGLAKAMESPAGSSPSLSMSPTITTPAMTQAGMILGTAAYMAPEQARGKIVDRRADIFAFGAVVFEMLTGRRAFGADDVSLTLAFVMTKEPDWTAMPESAPPPLRALLRRCLVKDPRRRLQAIGEARLQIEDLITAAPWDTAAGLEHPANPVPPISRPAAGWRQRLPWACTAAALAAAGVTLWSPWRVERPVDRRLVRLDVDLGAEVSLPAPMSAGSSVAIAPDGTRLVYSSGAPAKLFIRRLDQQKATELPGTQGATAPFFSSDSQWVGFVSNGKVNTISVDGGAVVPIAGATNVKRATWGEDGSIFVSASQKLVRIPRGGGAPETLAEPRDGELGLWPSQALPGGKALLFAADNPGSVDRTTINVITLSDRQRKTVVQGGASPWYLATGNGTGHLIYVNQATLFAIPFDLHTQTTRGTAVPVVDDVAFESLVGSGQFDVSRTGTLVYRRAIGAAAARTTLRWVEATGTKEPLQAKPANYLDLRLSPEGKRVAVTAFDDTGQDIFVYDLERDVMTRLTFGGGVYRSPTWSPDGRYVVFASVGSGIFQARADGGGQSLALVPSQTAQYPGSFTPDGKRLAYSENAGGGGQLWTVPLTEESGQLKAGKPEPFLKNSAIDTFPSFSPDGHWLAYASTEAGGTEVFVTAFPQSASGSGGRWQISTSGGTTPVWSRRGAELFYQSGDQIMAASYTVSGDTLAPGKPRVWVPKLDATAMGISAVWDLAPDGKRIAVVTPESADSLKQEHEVVFLQNFFDELQRRVPLWK